MKDALSDIPDVPLADIESPTTPPSDLVKAVTDAINNATRNDADPYILAGCLIEGIAMTVLSGVPAEQQPSVANDLLVLLYVRFDSLNMIAAPTTGDALQRGPVTRH